MVSVILGFFTSFITWLVAHLPMSPFNNIVFGFDGFAGSGLTIGDLMGWLNWIVPIGDMLLLFQTWCVAAMLVIALKVATKPVTRTVKDLTITG